jgi:hypothetical protein
MSIFDDSFTVSQVTDDKVYFDFSKHHIRALIDVLNMKGSSFRLARKVGKTTIIDTSDVCRKGQRFGDAVSVDEWNEIIKNCRFTTEACYLMQIFCHFARIDDNSKHYAKRIVKANFAHAMDWMHRPFNRGSKGKGLNINICIFDAVVP